MSQPEEKEEKKRSGSSNGAPSRVAELQELLKFIETTDLEFVQIEDEGKKILLRRSSAVFQKKEKTLEENSPLAKEKEEMQKTFPIRSPIVGRFHSSMGADRPPLVVEGGRVTAGQKVAVVVAMKIKKEVFSAYSGKVTKILVEDGNPVEYGQELFLVEPEL